MLINRAINALGGRELLEGPAYEAVSGTLVVRNPLRFSLDFALRRNHHGALVQWTCGGEHVIQCVADTGSWQQTDHVVCRGEIDSRPDIELYLLAWKIGKLLRAAGAPGCELKNLGLKRLPDGSLASCVRIMPERSSPAEIYLDTRTGLVSALGVCSDPSSDSDHLDWLIRFRGYVRQDRFLVPTHQDLYEDGTLTNTILLSRMDLRSPIGDTIFNCPRMPPEQPTTVVPFSYSGHIVVRGSVNGGPTRLFLVDTGACTTVLSRSAARDLGLPISRTREGTLMWAPLHLSGARIRSLRVGSAVVRDLSVELLEGRADRDVFGHTYAGALGYNFLGHFQVTLDFRGRSLVLAPRSRTPPRGTVWRFWVRSGQPVVEPPTQHHRYDLMVDSGSVPTYLPSGVIQALQHGPDRSWNAWLGPRGPRVTEHATRLQTFAVQGAFVHGLPVWWNTYDRDSPIDDTGVLGCMFLSNFRVTFDYLRHHIILEPRPGAYRDEWTHPGLFLRSGSQDSAIVYRVLPYSPASEAGLRPGDWIASIDGKITRGLPAWTLDYLLEGRARSEVRIKVFRRNRVQWLRIRRARLL